MNTFGINNYIVVPNGKLIFVLNAKLYLLKLPAVGESTDDTIHELNYDISSAIPIV